MYEENGEHCLEVGDVSKEDKGTYVVTVTSSAGTNTASAVLDIAEKEPDGSNQAPTLLSPLCDMNVVIGDRDVKLRCEVDVSEGSECRVRWYHEKEEIGEEAEGCRRLWTGRAASLILGQIGREHAGLYRCDISTAGHQVTTSCTLSVREPEKREPPFFIQELHDMEVEDGDKVELVVEVEGTPPLQVYWHHNNTPVTAETPGLQLHADNGVHSLRILRAAPQHGGEFVCEAYNQFGDTDSFCRLYVKEHADPVPPVFLIPPLSLTVPAGAPRATLTCRVKGHPLPAVTWTRRGTVLLTGGRYSVMCEGNTHSLQILSPQTADAGEYVCHAHSTAGSVTDRCCLLITEATRTDITGREVADSHDTRDGGQTELTDHGGEQHSTRDLPRPSQATTPSLSSAVNVATTTTTTISTVTNRLSRLSTSKGVSRSPSWHSTTPPFGIGIRVGSVRKRKDWFEQRASPSPDRATPGARRKAVSVDRQRQGGSGDRASPEPGYRRAVPGDGADRSDGTPSPGTDDRHAASWDVLAPAIYQFKTLSSPSESPDSVRASPSMLVPAGPGKGESGNGKPHSFESTPSTQGTATEAPDSHREDLTAAGVSADRQRWRTMQRAADSDIVRTLSPGRMDYRSVLKTAQVRTDSTKQGPGQIQQTHKADFRSVLKKPTDRAGTVRRLFPGSANTDSGQTENRQRISNTTQPPPAVSCDPTDEEQRQPSQPASNAAGERAATTEAKSVPQLACTAMDKLPESSENRYVTSAKTTIQLSVPVPASEAVSSGGEGSPSTHGGSDDLSRTAGTLGVKWEVPRVVQHLKDQRVRYGGHVLMRCAVSGHPPPLVTWTLNSKDIKPSKFFQLSYQEPHAQLLVAEAYSEDEGEYTCSATNALGSASTSCYLTVEAVSKSSVDGGEVFDISKESTSRLKSPSDEGSVVSCDVTEITSCGREKTMTARGDDQLEKELHPVSGTPIKSWEVGGGAGDPRQPMSDVSCSDVSGHLPAAGDASLPAASDVITRHQVPKEEQGELNQSRRTKVVVSCDRKFEDCYDRIQEVGRGKFGSVYECRQRRSGAVLAAKVLKVRSAARREDVRREVEVMNALCHPTLLLLHDAFEADRSMVLVTEFVRGGELLERVSGEQYVLTERDCVHFLRQLCEGMAYMHSRGVLHLDLKPNNVLCLSPDSNRIKIIDFGLARFYSPGDSLHVLFGTPEFIAPEVISYDQIGFATDMWSIGVITYILLSGLSPFLGNDDAETLANVTRGEYDFDDDCFDVITEDAKDFISCLLLKRKEKRLTADQCLKHAWLSGQDHRLGSQRLNTDNLRSFVAAHLKRWHKMAQAIMAAQRISSLVKMTSGGRTTSGAVSADSTHS